MAYSDDASVVVDSDLGILDYPAGESDLRPGDLNRLVRATHDRRTFIRIYINLNANRPLQSGSGLDDTDEFVKGDWPEGDMILTFNLGQLASYVSNVNATYPADQEIERYRHKDVLNVNWDVLLPRIIKSANDSVAKWREENPTPEDIARDIEP